MNLPLYPTFKKMDLAYFHEIENLNKPYPPYNDFEFASLWTYDTDGTNTVTILDGNLVIKIQDFITGAFFYSFLGSNNVINTISTLIQRSKVEGLGPELRLVPEISISTVPDLNTFFSVAEDLDSFDYILSIEEIAELKGKKYYDKRNLVNRFKKLYPDHRVVYLDLHQQNVQTEIMDLFLIWEKQKNRSRKDTQTELVAIKKLFDLVDLLDLKGIGIYYENKLIGFSTYHTFDNNYAIMTFEKGDTTYEGIYAYINHVSCKHLQTLGAKYLNYEQDLGIPGLKKAKQLWRPITYHKKYTIGELKNRV